MRIVTRSGLLALVFAALAVVSSAQAATISYSGGTDGAVVYAADSGETLDVTVGFHAACGTDGAGGALDCVSFYGNAVSWSPAGNCAAQASGEVWCLLDSDHSGVRVAGGAGADAISVLEADLDGFPAVSGYQLSIDGGPGNDRLDGGSGGETIHGGPGADTVAGRGGGDVLYGDDGNDTLYGDGTTNGNDGVAGGDDQLHGGAGDDVLTGDTANTNAVIGHDVLDGGPGTDTVEDDWYRYDGNGHDEDPAPTVTFDGAANDGRPGENDNVLGVERIESGVPAGATPATFAGDDGPNTFMLLFTNGVVSAGGGNDTIAGSDYGDRLDGGPGDDKISGGFGDDIITGGSGRDDIGGDRTAACEYGPLYGSCTVGSGNDTIYARDGEADSVDCGPGADTAYVDAVDTVAGCENVELTDHAPSGGSGGGAAGGKGSKPPAPVLSVPRQRLAKVARRRALVVRCRLRRAGRCRVVLTIAGKDARRLHLGKRHRGKAKAKRHTLGKASKRFRRAGRRTLRIALSKSEARALRRARSLRVRFTATATYAGRKHRKATARAKLRR